MEDKEELFLRTRRDRQTLFWFLLLTWAIPRTKACLANSPISSWGNFIKTFSQLKISSSVGKSYFCYFLNLRLYETMPNECLNPGMALGCQGVTSLLCPYFPNLGRVTLKWLWLLSLLLISFSPALCLHIDLQNWEWVRSLRPEVSCSSVVSKCVAPGNPWWASGPFTIQNSDCKLCHSDLKDNHGLFQTLSVE